MPQLRDLFQEGCPEEKSCPGTGSEVSAQGTKLIAIESPVHPADSKDAYGSFLK